MVDTTGGMAATGGMVVDELTPCAVTAELHEMSMTADIQMHQRGTGHVRLLGSMWIGSHSSKAGSAVAAASKEGGSTEHARRGARAWDAVGPASRQPRSRKCAT